MGRGDMKHKETKERKVYQNEMIRRKRSVMKVNGRRGSTGGAVRKEGRCGRRSIRRSLMRCAVSGQRPGSLTALRERKPTERGRKRAPHSNEFK